MMINTEQNQFIGEPDLFYLQVTSWNSRQNLKRGTEAEAMEKCSVLACFTWFVQPLSSTTWDILPGDETAHCGLGHSTSIINEETHPRAVPTDQYNRNDFSIQINLVCVILKKN